MSKKSRKSSKASKVLKAAGAAGIVLGGAALDANVVFAAELEGELEAQQQEEAEAIEREFEKELEDLSQVHEAAGKEPVEVVEGGQEAPEDDVPEGSTAEPVGNTGETAGSESGSESVSEEESGSESSSESVSEEESGSESSSESVSGEEINNPGDVADETDGDAVNVPGSDSQQSWSDVESTSIVNSDNAESESLDFDGESEDMQESASESDSAVISLSVENSNNASESASAELATSISVSTALSVSASEYEQKSETYQVSDLTSEMASALSTYDSALSELTSTSATGATDLEAAQRSVAESIIAYDFAGRGLTVDRFEWNSSGYYTVYYKDTQGRELTEVYQYSVDQTGKVSVNKADISYEAVGGKETTVTGGGKDKPPVKNETEISTEEAPASSYEITNNADGTVKVSITIKGTVYENPPRQINPDGTISYILNNGENGGIVELFVISEDGSNGYYTTYKKSSELINNSSGTTSIKTDTVSGSNYNVAGGGTGLFGVGQYVVVQDQKGSWHKLVYDGNPNQTLLIKNGNFKLQTGEDPKVSNLTDLGNKYTLRTDANGKYALYDSNGVAQYTFTIRDDVDYTTNTTVTEYTYDRNIGKGDDVTGHSEALSNYHSVLESTSEAISTSNSVAIVESESASIASETNSKSASASASVAESTSASTSEAAKSLSESFNSTSLSDSLSQSTSYSAALSESLSLSNSASESLSLSNSASESLSLSNSASESLSLSNSSSESLSLSNSASESLSLSNSASASTSAGTNASLSSSETTSASASTSISNSTSEAVGTGDGDTGAGEDVADGPGNAAADTAEPAGTVTIDDEEVPLGAARDMENTPQADADDEDEESTDPVTEEEEELAQIDDEEVPLAVIDEEAADEEPVEIDDEVVPLAASASTGTIWWSWIPVIGAIASTVDGYRKNKRKPKESDGNSKNE